VPVHLIIWGWKHALLKSFVLLIIRNDISDVILRVDYISVLLQVP